MLFRSYSLFSSKSTAPIKLKFTEITSKNTNINIITYKHEDLINDEIKNILSKTTISYIEYNQLSDKDKTIYKENSYGIIPDYIYRPHFDIIIKNGYGGKLSITDTNYRNYNLYKLFGKEFYIDNYLYNSIHKLNTSK